MFKLTLRELFLLTALAGVGCAWWLQYREACRLKDDLSNERLLARIADGNKQDAISYMNGMAAAVEREGFYFCASVEHGPYGARLVRLDEDESSSDLLGQTP